MAATVIKGGTAAGVSATISSHTDESFSRAFAEAVFDATSYTKALGVRAWNGKSNFGNVTKASGKGVRFDNGFQFSGRLAITAPSSKVLAKGGNVQAAERDDWTGWAYNWIRVVVALGIPEEDIQDNQGKARLASLLSDELKMGQMSMARDINYIALGNASAPTGGTGIGLPNLISVTNTTGTSIGGIDRAAAYWIPWYKSVGAPGGGGVNDKPLGLKRALEGAIIGTSGFASVMGPDLLVGNTGAYLTVSRMSERLDGMVSTQKVEKAFYDVGIPHMLVDGRPLIFDKAATAPVGGTTGDFIYGISTESTGLAFKSQEYFRTEPWKAPEADSTQRTYRSNVFCRITPYTRDRRANFVLHNITANSEATSD